MYQFHGCHWHGHTCLKNRTKRQQKRYKDTCRIYRLIKNNGWDTKYSLVSTWEYEEPILKKRRFEKKFTPYPHFIVYDLEARSVPLNECPTGDLTYLSRHIEISVAVNDTFSEERGEDPVYLADKNPERLVERFIEAVTEKQKAIAVDVLKQYPYPSDFQMLPHEAKKQWKQWVNQVPVIGFNSGKYHLNVLKKYFVKKIAYNKDGECNEDKFVAKKENDYMFLITPKFKFLDVKNFIGPGLSYDAWCKSMGCRLQKLMFPYEWLDSDEKLNHVGPIGYDDFYSNLKSSNITRDDYKRFLKLYKENDCTTMGGWLRVYNVADVVPFIETFGKMAEQYYPDKNDVCKDAVSIPGISMT